MDKLGYMSVIEYLQKKGLAPKAIHDDMVETLGGHTPLYATVKRWAVEFKHGRKSHEDDIHPGRPVTETTPGLHHQRPT